MSTKGGFSTAGLLTTRASRTTGSRLGLTSGDATREAVPAAVPRAGADVLLLVAAAVVFFVLSLHANPHTREPLLPRRLGVLLSNPTEEELLVGEEALPEDLSALMRLGGGSEAVSAFRLLTVAGSDLPTPGAADPGPVS